MNMVKCPECNALLFPNDWPGHQLWHVELVATLSALIVMADGMSEVASSVWAARAELHANREERN